MKRKTKIFASVCAVFCMLLGVSVAGAAVSEAELNKAFEGFQEYEWGDSREPFAVVDDYIKEHHDNRRALKEVERRLVDVLKGDAPDAAKTFACRKVSRIGTSESVLALAELLTDEDLSHMARWALQRIDNPAAADALRDALNTAEGEPKAGIIHSLGAMRDRKAVPHLIDLLDASNENVASAAMESLGEIGGKNATAALQKAFRSQSGRLRTAAAHALSLCADRFLEAGNPENARSIYRLIYEGNAPRPVRMAALGGLVATGDRDAVELVSESLVQEDSDMRATALRLVRETPGRAATKAFAGLLKRVSPDTKARLIQALAARGDAEALDAIKNAVGGDNEAVRVAALKALGTLGDASVVPTLALKAAEASDEEQEAARASLARLKGSQVNEVILQQIEESGAAVSVELIGALEERGAADTAPTMLELGKNAESEDVRATAIDALGSLAGKDMLGDVVDLIRNARNESIMQAGRNALVAMCERVGDRESCARVVVAGLKDAGVEASSALLSVCGRLGGPRALRALRNATESDEPSVKDAAIRALAGTSDPRAAEHLLEIARETSSARHRALCLRGYVRLVAAREDIDLVAKARKYRQAMELANRTAERRLVLSQLPQVPTTATLEMAEKCLEDEELKEEAAMAMVGIAEGLASSNRKAAVGAIKDVLEVSRNDAVKKRAREALDEVQKYAGYIQDWLLAGPYTEKGKGDSELFDTVFPPEKEDAGVDWRRIHLSGAEHIVVDLDERLGGKDRVAYLRADVWSKSERKARLELGSDDGIKAWLNGSVVHANNTNRGISPGQDQANVTLEKGWNTLLLKITQGGGNWAASARLRAAEGGKLKDLRVRAEE